MRESFGFTPTLFLLRLFVNWATVVFLPGSVADQLTVLNRREQAIRQDSQFVGQWIPNASDQEQVSYFDRLKLYGESAAIEWLKNRSQ